MQATDFFPHSFADDVSTGIFVLVQAVLVIPETVLKADIKAHALVQSCREPSVYHLPAAVESFGGTRKIGIPDARGKLLAQFVFESPPEVHHIAEIGSNIIVDIRFIITESLLVIFRVRIKDTFGKR